MGQAPIMGGLCKFKAPNMGVNVLQNFDNDNWLWQIDNWLTVTMTKVIDKDSKKESKIDLMPKLYCIC